jgi:hypothetical protein
MLRPLLNLLAFLLFITAYTIDCQAQCLVNSLTINTGYDPIANAAITPLLQPANTPDPHWYISGMSPGCAALPNVLPVGSPADVVQTLNGIWVTDPNSNWLSIVDTCVYETDGQGTIYTMDLSRDFRMCSDDSVIFDLHIAHDNDLPYMKIDGVTYWNNPGNGYVAFSHVIQHLYLTSGTHTLTFRINNSNNGAYLNASGLNLYGTVSSITGQTSLVSESNANCATYVCGIIQNISCSDTLVLQDTVSKCAGSTTALNATLTGTDSVLSINWTPANNLSAVNILNPTTTAQVSSEYYLTVQTLQPTNLITNGDFSQGNTGFNTTYTLETLPVSSTPGHFAITTNPHPYNGAFPTMGDHTSGTGNMMLVDGSQTANQSFWCQTVNVQPNTNYIFTIWTALLALPVPTIQLQINGVQGGSTFTTSNAQAQWNQTQINWNSGAATSADICLYDESLTANGNDFVIDDISFNKICVLTDSVYIKVPTLNPQFTANATQCSSSFQFVATDAGNPSATFSWNFGDNNTATGNTASHIYNAGTYTVTLTETDAMGCTATITQTVTAFNNLTLTLTADTAVCAGGSVQLLAGGATNYAWSPVQGLSAVNIANPVATINHTITYYVYASENGCNAVDSITIHALPIPSLTVTSGNSGCRGDSVQLNVSGANSYVWVPAAYINNSQIADPVVTPQATTYYMVTGTDNDGCKSTDSILVTVFPQPSVAITKSSDIDCQNSSVTLVASGAENYNWYPGHLYTDSTSAQQIIAPVTTTVYYVKGTSANGCTGIDSIRVTDDSHVTVFMPNAFTPNKDGRDDVISPLIFCDFVLEKYNIYNRWGNLVFTTSTKGDGWMEHTMPSRNR